MTTEPRTAIPLASTAAALVLTGYSTLKPPRDGSATRETLVELAIVLAVAAVTFLLTVRATRSQGPSARAALVLAIGGLLSIAVFWLGIFSVVLAGGAALLALESRRRAGRTTAGTAALVIAAVTLVLSVLIAVVS